MTELLTTNQVSDLLKVDRTTIYRMLNDGRLKGIKVGGQWRFARETVEALTSGVNPTSFPSSKEEISPLVIEILPVSCIQAIQDVFAEIIQVGSITTHPNGQPITEISNSCQFCDLILTSDSGRQGCINSWRKLAHQPKGKPKFITCHAGLQYARARIELNETLLSILVAGQFYSSSPNPQEERKRVQKLAKTHHLDEDQLLQLAKDISVLNERIESQIARWLEKVAGTFEHIVTERADLKDRLQRIALLSNLEPEES